ncbi:MAG: hypothetical protein ABI315_02470 [Bacteroidia bacterium]
MNKEKQEKKSTNKVVVILLLLLLMGNGIFGWLWWTEKNKATLVTVEKDQIEVERQGVKAELLLLQEQYASLHTNDENLQKEFDAKRAEIEVLLEEADKHKNDGYIIAKLKKETETLRTIMKHYVVQIDSLHTLNQTMVAEKQQVSQDLTAEKTKTEQLAQEKVSLQSTISLGSVLQAEDPIATGVKFKSGGTKEIETTKASRVEKIKVSFEIGENKIAKTGTKQVYVRITTPDGKELSRSDDEADMIKFNGSKGFYAGTKSIEYSNAKIDVDIFCASPTPFIPGKYLIDIICDAAIIGQTSVTLK